MSDGYRPFSGPPIAYGTSGMVAVGAGEMIPIDEWELLFGEPGQHQRGILGDQKKIKTAPIQLVYRPRWMRKLGIVRS